MELSVFLPGHWFDLKQPPRELYEDLVKQAQLAEVLGFDGAWLAEHHFNNYVAQPSPFQLAALISSKTSRIRLGIAVVVVTFHHPLRLAGELAQLDVLTEGRLDVAVGRGAFPWEAHQMGIRQTDQENREYCSEHLLVMARTLRSRMRAVDYDGKLWKFSNVAIIPPTYTESSPSFSVAAQRPDSVPWAVSSCLDAGLPPVLFCSQLRRPFKLIEDMRAAFDRELKARKESGGDVKGAKFAVNQVIHLAPTVEQARKESINVLYPLNRGVHNLQVTTEEARAFVKNGIVTETPLPNEPTEEALLNNTIITDPKGAIEHISRYRDLGVDHLSLHFNMGQPHELVARSMKLFAEKVMPALK